MRCTYAFCPDRDSETFDNFTVSPGAEEDIHESCLDARLTRQQQEAEELYGRG